MKQDAITNSSYVKKIIWECYKPPHTYNKCDNLDEVTKFLKTTHLGQFIQYKVNNLNNLTIIKEIKSINFPPHTHINKYPSLYSILENLINA
jgi:hypothetical protein